MLAKPDPAKFTDTQKAEATYRFELSEYKEQQARIREAQAVITFTVAPDIRFLPPPPLVYCQRR